MTVTIRTATAGDADAICTVHNQGIVDRVATLDTSTRTPDDVRTWLTQRGPRHPVIVAEIEGGVVAGWGSLNPFNPRAAYDFVADFSVYVERQKRGQGIGRRLLDRLVELARAAEYHKMVLSALASNDAGVGLYASAGFSRVGVYREQGQLDGKWVDVVVMEKLL
jgi:L-amino acid N-acyltransferase YncA